MRSDYYQLQDIFEVIFAAIFRNMRHSLCNVILYEPLKMTSYNSQLSAPLIISHHVCLDSAGRCRFAPIDLICAFSCWCYSGLAGEWMSDR
jgi:hypothetical protein